MEDCQDALKNPIKEELASKNIMLLNEEKYNLDPIIQSGIDCWADKNSTESFNHEGMSFSYRPLEGQIWKCVQWGSQDFTIYSQCVI